ncbi:amidase domain-containing protein [Haematococcus lacustris]|uniref:Amidase domain-containing protein n=1 Tax=Haematococcus lacustris TaxID=44745 RepID=A0A699YGU2_HAELA|nr:amidase domain-containing protein [Haematococcus lacustris]
MTFPGGSGAALQVLRADRFVSLGQELLRECGPDALAAVKPEVAGEISRGNSQSVQALREAQAGHQQYVARVLAFMAEYQLLVLPTVLAPPFPAGKRWLTEHLGVSFAEYTDWLVLTFALSLAPLPVLSLPCGVMPGSNLPIGMQLVGPPGSDAQLLTVAAAYERAHPWVNRVPRDPA